MELERHKKLNFLGKDTKIPKNIEKNNDIYFFFDTLGSIKTF
jgi:hypothetical protein